MLSLAVIRNVVLFADARAQVINLFIQTEDLFFASDFFPDLSVDLFNIVNFPICCGWLFLGNVFINSP